MADPGAILLEQVLQAVALGGRVLGVCAHVQVEAPAVAQEEVRGAPLVQERLEQLASGVLGVHRRCPRTGTRPSARTPFRCRKLDASRHWPPFWTKP